jgi:hypothetical protein
MKAARSAIAIMAAVVLSSAGTGAAQSSGAGPMTGRHSMEGQVTSIDAKKGWVHVKTQEGTMIVHFPPESLQGVKKGDTISVSLALQDNGPAVKERK